MKLERSNVARIDGEILPVWNQSRGVFPRVGIGITRLSSAGVVTLRVSWAWTHVSQKGLFLQAASSGSKPISVLISADRFPVRRRQRNRTTNNAGVREKIKYMQLKVSVISDRPDEYVGKKGLVKSQIITCQDVDPSGYRLLMPFDYTLSEDEKPKYAGKLLDKQIVVGVRELVPFGGRLRARGAIISGPEGKN